MAGCQVAFLLAHGSFNPVHRQHIEMMVLARQRLEAAGFRVLRGIVATTNRSYIKKKGVDAVSDNHRLAALQLGCAAALGPSGWLTHDERGVNYGSAGQMIKAIGSELRREAPGAVIFKVLGADTAVRYANELRSEPTVIVCREGSTAALRQAIDTLDPERLEKLFLVEELPGEECSSTKLRAALQRQDADAVRAMCPGTVAEYLLQHCDELYEEPKHNSGNRAETSRGRRAAVQREAWGMASSSSVLSSSLKPATPACHAPTSVVALSAGAAPLRRRVVLVGIAGASGSGKSTLAKSLVESFRSPVVAIGADQYNSPARVDPMWGKDWETPAGMDFKRLRADVLQVIDALAIERRLPRELCIGRNRRNVLRRDVTLPVDGNAVFVFVEGFLLFHDAELAGMCDVQLWVEAECETSLLRRYSRKAFKKQSLQEFSQWYHGLVWRSYLENRDIQLVNARLALKLCGEDDASVVLASAEDHCRAVPLSSQEIACAEGAASVAAQEVPHRIRRWNRR